MKPTKRTLVHFVFTPKYRRAVLRSVEDMAYFLICRACAMRGIEIAECAVMPDHVHLLCYLPPTLSVSKAAGFVKWYVSLNLRREYGKRGMVSPAHFWGDDFFSKSVGGDAEAQRRYIKNQRFAE